MTVTLNWKTTPSISRLLSNFEQAALIGLCLKAVNHVNVSPKIEFPALGKNYLCGKELHENQG